MATDSLQSLSNLTLCDYFAIIGFDKITGIQLDKMAEHSSDLVGQSMGVGHLKSPLDCSYEAKVLTHFPRHRDGFPFAYEISSLCMPKGLKFYTERKVPKEPNFHSFILVKEDGSRVNGCSLIFYEPLVDADIRQQIFDMQMEYVRKMAADNFSVSAAEDSAHGTFKESVATISRDRSSSNHCRQCSPGTVSSGDYTLPRKSSRRSARGSTASADSSGESPRRRPRQARHRSQNSQNKKRASFYDSVSKPIFVSKCICFITREPIVYSVENLLQSLWAMVTRRFAYLDSPIMPVESVIYWALHEVPLPLPGTCLQINYGECNLVVKRPSGQELPLFDYPIQILFNFINIERFIRLFTCFMLEHQILICSKHMNRLMLFAECLSALIFPFRWQLTYVPILPYSQLKFIEAPVPYLMGLCYDDKVPDQIFQSNVCVFDIDTGRLEYPEDIPAFPKQRELAVQIQQIHLRFCHQHQNTVQNARKSSRSDVETAGSDVVVRRRRNSPSSSGGSGVDESHVHGSDMRAMKRMSRSFDNTAGFSSLTADEEPVDETEESGGGRGFNAAAVLEPNSLSYAGGVVEKETIVSTADDRNRFESINANSAALTGDSTQFSSRRLPKHVESYNAYLRGLKFNRAIRELFLCNFSSLFASYEHFIIGGSQESRDSVVNFDKVSFLSDQPESYLPFLAAFLETQMFTSFIDAKILSHCHAHNEDTRCVAYFDRTIARLIDIVGKDATNQQAAVSSAIILMDQPLHGRPLDFLFRSTSFAAYQSRVWESDLTISADYEVDLPHLLSPTARSRADDSTTSELQTDVQLSLNNNTALSTNQLFPELRAERFELLPRFRNAIDANGVMTSPWKQQNKKQRVLNIFEDAASRLASNENSTGNNNENAVESPVKLAQQNKKFVVQLLKETKTKTKRMLVAKMGKEAVHLGHSDLGVTGVEENTLVAGLCDLLERIWSHGLKKKQGKSALWSHIYAHYDQEKLENFMVTNSHSNFSSDKQHLQIGRLENEEQIDREDGGENAKALNELLEAIRSIAKSIEPLNENGIGISDGIDENIRVKNSAEKMELKLKNECVNQFHGILTETANSNAGNSTKSIGRPTDNMNNNSDKGFANQFKWQNPLFKAANFIVEKIDKIATVDAPQVKSKRVFDFNAKSTNLAGTLETNRNIKELRSTLADDFNSIQDDLITANFVSDENDRSRITRKSRNTERRSTINFEFSSDETRGTSNNNECMERSESRPRFYHHEDEYSKRLRHASRQRRAAAAAAAMAATTMARKRDKVFDADDEANTRNPTRIKTLSKPQAQNRQNTMGVNETGASQLQTQTQQFPQRIEEIMRLARDKLTDVTRGSTFNSGDLRLFGQDKRDECSSRAPSTNGLYKSSSIADFAPHWSAKSGFFGGSGSENAGLSASMISTGESQTLGRPASRAAAVAAVPRNRSASRSRGLTHRGSEPIGGANGESELDQILAPLPTNMAYDLRNVMRMTEIKSDIGFARAFVRLALERKLLHKYLKTVLADGQLLQKMYKRYAFLRCEDEREQFLYHILSLNAVDFSCFTYSFISTKTRYEVALVASIDRFSSSSIWIMLTGSLGSTSTIYLPSNSLQFQFDFKNLGALSTLRIGHSTGEKCAYPSKWYLAYVLVRNNVTAQTYLFNCGRWFGRGVDDGALERLLVAETIHGSEAVFAVGSPDSPDGPAFGGHAPATRTASSMAASTFASSFGFNNFISRPESPIHYSAGGVRGVSAGVSSQKPAVSGISTGQKSANYFGYSTASLTRRSRRSPSVGIQHSDYGTGSIGENSQNALKITDLEHKLGMAVNALVKHFFTEKDYRSGARLTALLCGENGLVPYLEQVFELGRQDTLFSNRFFRQPYPWDYIERVFAWFVNFFRNGESRKLTREQRSLIIYTYNLVVKIGSNNAVGKEGKFHIFMLLTLRDHILSGLLPLMVWTPVTKQIYDEDAFLRQPQHLSYLAKLLASLNEFNFTLEKSLLYGIDL